MSTTGLSSEPSRPLVRSRWACPCYSPPSMRLLEILYMRPSSTLTLALLLAVGLLIPTPAQAGAKAARQALKELREGRQD